MMVERASGRPEVATAAIASGNPGRYPILHDTKFHRPLWLSGTVPSDARDGPTPAAPEFTVGILDLFEDGPPAWRLGQWGSRHSLEETPARIVNASGNSMPPESTVTYANPGKRVAVVEGGEVLLEVAAEEEYIRPRAGDELWVHLLLEQAPLHPSTSLADIARLDFGLTVRLDRLDDLHRSWSPPDPSIHAAQFVAFFTVASAETGPPGAGDMFWFGIPMIDTRYATPDIPGYYHNDEHSHGSFRFINMDPGTQFWRGDLRDGEWHELEIDLRPLIDAALDRAQQRGSLTVSGQDELFITSFNMGWEVTGTYHCAARVKDLRAYVT